MSKSIQFDTRRLYIQSMIGFLLLFLSLFFAPSAHALTTGESLPYMLSNTSMVLQTIYERISADDARELLAANTTSDPEIVTLLELLEELTAMYQALLAERAASENSDDTTVLSAAAPLSLATPNGGESYTSGKSTIVIKYNSIGMGGKPLTAHLLYSVNAEVQSVSGIAANSGELKMELKGGLRTGFYKVRLCMDEVTDALGQNICDTSSSYFTVLSDKFVSGLQDEADDEEDDDGEDYIATAWDGFSSVDVSREGILEFTWDPAALSIPEATGIHWSWALVGGRQIDVRGQTSNIVLTDKRGRVMERGSSLGIIGNMDAYGFEVGKKYYLHYEFPTERTFRINGNKRTGSGTPSTSRNSTPATLSRDYIGTADFPCQWGEPLGPCKYQGKLMSEAYPPPSATGFKEKDSGEVEYYRGTNHQPLFLGGGKKWAVKFRGDTAVSSFPVVFGGGTEPNLQVPMEMFVSISREKGDFDVKPSCLVTPASLSNPGAGGAPHSYAKIEVVWKGGVYDQAPWNTNGTYCVLEPSGHYYVNVAGTCSQYWDPDHAYLGWQNDCPTVLVNTNGWMGTLSP